jgi:hypothetical protein
MIIDPGRYFLVYSKSLTNTLNFDFGSGCLLLNSTQISAANFFVVDQFFTGSG